MSNNFKILVRKFDPFERIVEKFWVLFKAKTHTELDLDVVALPLPELYDAILHSDYDVAHVNTDWLAASWEEGVLENLLPYVQQNPPEDYPEGWFDGLLKLQTFSDGLAGIPFHDGPECLIYRKDLFNDEKERAAFRMKYNSELHAPQNWGEFVKTAEFFNRPEKGMYGTLFALYPDGHNNIFDFALQLWSRGGSLTNQKGNITLDTPEALQSLTFYRKLINSTFIHPKSRDLESIGACWTFAQGEVAMMVNWFGFATMCETVEGSLVKGKIDICAVPCGEVQSKPVSLNVYYTWSVSSRSTHKQSAYEFIRHSVSAENDKLLPFMGAIGCRRSTWFDSKVNTLIPYYSKMEEIHGYAKTLPRTRIWHSVSTIIDEMVIQVIGTERAIDEILREAQEKIWQVELNEFIKK